MKRTNLVLDKDKLELATRLLGAKTYSEAVNRALDETIQLQKARGLLRFMGSAVWEGDLGAMRDDAKTKSKK